MELLLDISSLWALWTVQKYINNFGQVSLSQCCAIKLSSENYLSSFRGTSLKLLFLSSVCAAELLSHLQHCSQTIHWGAQRENRAPCAPV